MPFFGPLLRIFDEVPLCVRLEDSCFIYMTPTKSRRVVISVINGITWSMSEGKSELVMDWCMTD